MVDTRQFDHVVRSLQEGAPRRRVLGALLGGALGLAVLAESPAKDNGKSKSKGGGKGKGNNKDKRKKKPKKTLCETVSNGCSGPKCGMDEPCCFLRDCDCREGLWCQAFGQIVEGEIGTCGCTAGEEFHNGRCGFKPDCIPAGQKRGMNDVQCCSGSEVVDINSPANGTCLPGNLWCLSNADCTGGSCRGYSCYAIELDCNVYSLG